MDYININPIKSLAKLRYRNMYHHLYSKESYQIMTGVHKHGAQRHTKTITRSLGSLGSPISKHKRLNLSSSTPKVSRAWQKRRRCSCVRINPQTHCCTVFQNELNHPPLAHWIENTASSLSRVKRIFGSWLIIPNSTNRCFGRSKL